MELVTCPKCKGCGKVKPKRTRGKIVKSDDPAKKWCYRCKQFKDVLDFYKGTSNCKKCHLSKPRKKRKNVNPLKIRKFDITCVICFAKAKGFSPRQQTCSRICHVQRMNNIRAEKSLPHHVLREITGIEDL